MDEEEAAAPIADYSKQIVAIKELRRDIDPLIARITDLGLFVGGAEAYTATQKLKEGVMWLGLALKELGAANPYPNSRNPGNAIVDPTADGLKFGGN